MGRQLSDAVAFAPTVDLRKPGEMFKGQLVSKRTQNFGDRVTPIYKFLALDADCHFRQGKVDVDPPAEGTEVEVIPSSRLAAQLAQALTGNTYTITRLEDGKTKRFGNAPKIYSVVEE
jgi:hypothetical protein